MVSRVVSNVLIYLVIVAVSYILPSLRFMAHRFPMRRKQLGMASFKPRWDINLYCDALTRQVPR